MPADMKRSQQRPGLLNLGQQTVTEPVVPRVSLLSVLSTNPSNPHYKRETEALKASHIWTELIQSTVMCPSKYGVGLEPVSVQLTREP